MKNPSPLIRIPAGFILRTLCVAALLAASVLPSFGQSAVEKAKRDIEAHRAWVEAHVPVADTLNDEQLILAALDAVSTTCLEDKYVDLIRQAGLRFGSEDLEKYADLRKSGAIDRGGVMGLACIERLYEQALITCGSPSYTTAFSAMWVWNTSGPPEDRERRADIFIKEAKKLYNADACNRNKEIWLLSRWVKMFKGPEDENPLLYEPCHRLIAETLKFEHDYQGSPAVSALLYFFAYSKSTYGFYNHSNYYAYINQRLAADPKQKLRKRDVIPGSKSNEIITGSDILNLEFNALKKMYHDTHPDRLFREMDIQREFHEHGSAKLDDTTYINRLKEILEYQQKYYPLAAMTLAVRTAIRQYELEKLMQGDNNINAFHAKNYREEWGYAKQYVADNNRERSLLGFLAQEFNRQVECEPKNAVEIVGEMERLINEGQQINPFEKLLFKLPTAVLERKELPYYSGSFRNITNEYLELCKKEKPSWESVSIGKFILEYAQNLFNDTQTEQTIRHAILLQLEELVGKVSPVFCYEYFEYCNAAVFSNIPALTLDGKEDKQALIGDLLTCCTHDPVIAYPAYMCAAHFYSSEAEYEKADDYFRKVLKFSETQPEEQRKDVRINCYTGLLFSAQNRGCSADTLDTYARVLIQEAEKNINKENANNFLFTLTTLTNYYINRNMFKEGKAWLERCISLYDSPYMDPMDGTYITLVTSLINYYTLIESDLNKSLALAEEAEAKFGSFKNLGNYENYIGLLRIVYDLIEYKTPYDDVMLNKYWGLLSTNIQNYYAASNGRPDVWLNHKLYLYMKHIGKANQAGQRRASAIASNTLEQYDRDWNTYKESFVSNGLPDLLAMKAYLEDNHLEGSQYYLQVITCLAIAYDKIMEDAETAETYYKLSAQSENAESIMALLMFQLSHERYTEALATCKRLEELWEKNLPTATADGENFSSASMIYSTLFCMTHYFNNDFATALRYARDYHRNAWSYINKNFDLFTQNERETFLNTYSAGGGFLKILLPHYPDEIAGEVYDCMLQEKGLLLRSAERVRRAIFASGNQKLKQSLDSINALTQQLSLLEKDKLATAEGQKELLGLRERLDRLERYASRESEPYRTEDDVPAWTAVRDKLRKGEAAVEYVVTDSATMALVITPQCERPQYVHLIGADEMIRIAEPLARGKFNEVAVDFYEDDKEQLYARLWQPLEKYFDGARHIYFSPSGYLNSLAFAAFKTAEDEYLIDRYELHQVTTTAQLARRGKKEKPSRSATIYGSIFYNASQAKRYAPLIASLAQEAPEADPEKLRAAIRMESFPFLESTPYELSNIRKSFAKSKVKATTQEGDAPTEQAFRTNDGNSPDILHISTHGFYFPTPSDAAAIPYFRKFSNLYPMNCSGLVLSGAEQAWKGADLPLESDNILTSNEIATLNLENTRLVVLSACETALGANSSDGVFGLQRGFKQAGVRSVCASLWSVNDASTSSFMQTFYRLWLNEGQPMQEAFKNTMIEQRAKTPPPYYWAPFVMLDADI